MQVAVCPSANGACSKQDGLVANYNFEEKSLGITSVPRNDATACHHNLTDPKNVPSTTDHHGGEFAAKFSATTGDLEVADSPSLSVFHAGKSYTISFWYQLISQGPTTAKLVIKGTGGGVGREFGVESQLCPPASPDCANHTVKRDHLHFGVTGVTGAVQACIPIAVFDPKLSFGQWHHVFAWHDDVNKVANIQVDNGQIFSTSTSSITIPDTASPLRIGGMTNGIDGIIDDVWIWNRLLTIEERTSVFETGLDCPARVFPKGTLTGPFTQSVEVDGSLKLTSDPVGNIEAVDIPQEINTLKVGNRLKITTGASPVPSPDPSPSSSPTPSPSVPPGSGPVISKITTPYIFDNRVMIQWKTDVKSDSQVEYGVSTTYGNSTQVQLLKVNVHYFVLTNLIPDTPYNFRVKSRNQDGLAVSSNATFRTLPSKAWTAPIGGFVPVFGINEKAGQATHLVNNKSTLGCTSAGSGLPPSKPLCWIPLTLQAGTVVEVHGGPYNFNSSGVVYTALGTVSQPVFIKGVNDGKGPPVIFDADPILLMGSYMIFEGFDASKSYIRIAYNSMTSTINGHHIVVRNTEIREHPAFNGADAWGNDNGYVFNHIHHHQIRGEQMGMFAGQGSNRIFFYDNIVHHNSGDGGQWCHGCELNPPKNTVAGRNIIFSNRENAIDLKASVNSVITQNKMFGHVTISPTQGEFCYDDGSFCEPVNPNNISDGTAVVFGSSGAASGASLLFNEIYKNGYALRIEETKKGGIVVGNIMTDNKWAAVVTQQPVDTYDIVANTISGSGEGLAINAVSSKWNIQNNIIQTVPGKLAIRFDHTFASNSKAENNLFYTESGQVKVNWGGVTYTNLIGFTGGTGNLVGNPMFVGSPDFHLNTGSPAINKGMISTVYDAFFAISGVSIKFDFDGTPIPIGAYDIGAYEK